MSTPDMAQLMVVVEAHTKQILEKEFGRKPTDDEFFAALACMKHGVSLGAKFIQQSLGL